MYVVRNEFSGYARNCQTDYALLLLEEKKKVKNTLLNVLVELNQYKVVKNFKAGSIAIANARSNTIKAVENTCTIAKKNVISSFNENNYFMKLYSHPNDFPHNININEKGLIKCDSNCPRYNVDGFCSHAIAFSLQTKCLKKYACALSKSAERIATAAIVPQKIDVKKVGRKSVTRPRKIGSPEKKLRVSSQNNVFINPNESLAKVRQITEGIQRLHAPLVTFLYEFIRGLFKAC